MALIREIKVDRKNAIELKKYLTDERKRHFPYHIPWKGPKLVMFEVYRVPIDILHYNFDNTRIRAELEGVLHQSGEKPNPESKKHRNIVENILLESKYYGEIETKKLTEDLKERGQLDPAVATTDGILIDGNRRLAIFRHLTKNPKFTNAFSEIEICVLPEDATKDELKELEMRMQMSHTFKVGYGKINTALEFRNLHRNLDWSLDRIEKVTGKEYKKKEIETMINVIDLIDEYLTSLPPTGTYEKHYTKLSKGWESFDNLNNILNYWKRKHLSNNELKRIKLFGYAIINYEPSTYADVRNFGHILKDKKAFEKLQEESDILKGKNLDEFLEDKRIKHEIENLKIAKEILKQSQEDPTKSLKLAFKRLDSIKISKIKKNDEEFIMILKELKKKIIELEKKLT